MGFVPSEKTIRAAFRFSDLDSHDLERFRFLAKTDRPQAALHKADSLICGYGAGTIYHPSRGVIAFYVNTGDTYAATLLWNAATKAWRVTTFGDFVEMLERRRGRAFTESLSCY